MKIYTGLCASSGLVIAPIRRWRRGLPTLPRLAGTPEQETARLREAIETAEKELNLIMANIPDEDNREIIDFQCMMLHDKSLVEPMEALIAEGKSAVEAAEIIGRTTADSLFSMEGNEYMQLRGLDIRDVSTRLIDVLNGRSRRRRVFSRPSIFAGELFLPSDLAASPPGTLLGVLTAAGSPLSHSAFLAQSMGIPAICQLGTDFLVNCDGHYAVVDADAGRLILDPGQEERQHAVSRIMIPQRRAAEEKGILQAPCKTTDGETFTLLANCFGPDDIRSAMTAGASGVGLVRSEYLIKRGYSPSEDEQFTYYRDCLLAAGGKPVTIRTFDIGADVATLDLVKHRNLDLGMRGIRYSLDHPEEFETQLCALLRAGLYGPLSVCLPMISGPSDWNHAMVYVERAKDNLRRRGIPFDGSMSFGAMLEIPSACLQAEELPALGCRFFCIGLNDLVQYTHAADRNDYQMSVYYRTASPAISKLIRMALDAANAADIPVAVNGIALENYQITTGLLSLGCRIFSLPAQSMLSIKEKLLESEAGSTVSARAAKWDPDRVPSGAAE